MPRAVGALGSSVKLDDSVLRAVVATPTVRSPVTAKLIYFPSHYGNAPHADAEQHASPVPR